MFEQMIAEYSGLTAPELDDVIAEAELAIRAAELRLAGAAAVVSARGSFRDDGHRSMRSFLKATLNCSGGRANRIRRCATTVDRYPAIGDALLAGRVGVEQVDLLAKASGHPVAGDLFTEFAPQLLEHAEQLEHGDFDKVVSHFVQMADPDGSFDDQRFREDRRTATISTSNGSLELHASGGSPLVAAEIEAVFRQAVQAEFDKDCEVRRRAHGDGALAAPLPRTAEQRKFDALHSIFMASVALPVGGLTPTPLVNVLVDHITAGDVLHRHGLIDSPDILGIGDETLAVQRKDLVVRECSIDGTPVHPDVAMRAMLTGRVRRAVVDADRVVIDLGRAKRLFTGRARDAAQLLVVTCTHRGCDIPARSCDIDHRAEWSGDGGPTDQSNAMPACGGHDRWKHRRRIRTRRAMNGRIFLIRPDGSTIKPVGAREPEWSEPEPTGTRPDSPFDRHADHRDDAPDDSSVA